MDERALIIASGNSERPHQRHEGAVLALTENRVVEIERRHRPSAAQGKAGINLPSPIRGELLGGDRHLGDRTSFVLTPSWCASTAS